VREGRCVSKDVVTLSSPTQKGNPEGLPSRPSSPSTTPNHPQILSQHVAQQELPPLKGPTGRLFTPHRRVIEGAIYRLRTGIAWRDLPAEFGPWQTVWKRHYRFSQDGTWDKV
jgi:hypothetical protein